MKTITETLGENPSYIEILRAIGVFTIRLAQEGASREESFEKAFELFSERIASEAGSKSAKALQSFLQNAIAFAHDWAVNAFPTIEVGEKLTASFMASKVSRESLENLGDVRLPWKCFAIKLPGTLFGIDPGRPPEFEVQPQYILMAESQTNGSLFRISFEENKNGRGQTGHVLSRSLNLAELAEGPSTEVEWPEDEDFREGLSVDYWERRFALERRAILGVCLELDGPTGEAARSKSPKHVQRDKRGLPKSWTFQLIRPVRLDVRQAVQDFANSIRSKVNVQTLVRGHHKRQVCGLGGLERKWIHIEPYWRGPDIAPIAVRSHLLEQRE